MSLLDSLFHHCLSFSSSLSPRTSKPKPKPKHSITLHFTCNGECVGEIVAVQVKSFRRRVPPTPQNPECKLQKDHGKHKRNGGNTQAQAQAQAKDTLGETSELQIPIISHQTWIRSTNHHDTFPKQHDNDNLVAWHHWTSRRPPFAQCCRNHLPHQLGPQAVPGSGRANFQAAERAAHSVALRGVSRGNEGARRGQRRRGERAVHRRRERGHAVSLPGSRRGRWALRRWMCMVVSGEEGGGDLHVFWQRRRAWNRRRR